MPHRKDDTKGAPLSTALAKHSGTHFILILSSTPTNFKDTNMHLTALLHNDRISQVLETKHVFMGHTKYKLQCTRVCQTVTYGSSEATQ